MEEFFSFFNNPKYLNTIQGFGAIGTFIAALISLFTLKLIRKQIKLSQRLNIVLVNSIYAQCHPKGSNIFNSIWSNGSKKADKSYNSLSYEILNVGIGFAEHVRFKEQFNHNLAMKFIKNMDTNNDFDISIVDSVLRIKPNFEEDWIRLELSDYERKLGSFPVLNPKSKPNKYIFNEEYLAFLSCISYLKENNDPYLSLDEFPSLKLRLTFKDVDGKKYSNKYTCKPFSINPTSFSFSFIKV